MQELEKILEKPEINAIKQLKEDNEDCYRACEGACSNIKEGKCRCGDGLIILAIEKMKNKINDDLVEYDADLDAPFGDIDNIIGWQPSPEPYRPERGNERMMWIGYAAAWISTAAAVIAGVYFTGSAWCLWALLLPAMIGVKNSQKNGEEMKDE